MSKLIIDWSVIAHINWHKMKMRDYIPELPLEIGEFAKNMTEHIFYLTKRFPADDIVFAIDDTKNWRSELYNAHYEKAVDFYKSKAEACHWYAIVDTVTYRVMKNDSMNKWFVDKLSGKDAKAVDLQNPELYIPLIGGELPEEIKATLPEGAPTNARQHPDWVGLKLVVPEYKGTRKGGKWDFETPKDEWKVLVRKLAKNMAHVMGARCIGVDNTEGDDIIAVYCLANRDEEITMVTIDSDLEQLRIPCSKLQIWNPKKRAFVENTTNAIQMHLLCKILGGDTADNIKGVRLRGKLPFSVVSWDAEGNLKDGKKTVNWIRKQFETIGADNFAGIYDLLLTKEIKKKDQEPVFGLADPDTMNKNLNLVFLANIPQVYKDAILKELDTIKAGVHVINPVTEKPFVFSDFQVTTARLMQKEREAMEDREAFDN